MKQRIDFIHLVKYYQDRFPLGKSTIEEICHKYSNKYKTDSKNEEILSYLQDSSFRRDKRTPEEYCYDLCEGWLIEDFFLLCFNKYLKDATIALSGIDKERKIVSTVTSDTDFTITTNNENINIQLKFANQLFKEINLKPSKHDNQENYYILFYFGKENQIILFKPKEKIDKQELTLTKNARWNDKLTYCLTKETVLKFYKPMSLSDFFDRLKEQKILVSSS
jgi:hypothetical protein